MIAHAFERSANPYDAVHGASLGATGLSDMATLDHGFAALSQARLGRHTTNAHAVTMRRRRARSAAQ
jgi:hypothetical protein